MNGPATKSARPWSWLVYAWLLGGCATSSAEPSAIPPAVQTDDTFAELEPVSTADLASDATTEFHTIVTEYAAAKAAGPLDEEACDDFEVRFMALGQAGGQVGLIAEFNAAAVAEECGKGPRALEMYRGLCDRKLAIACSNLGIMLHNAGEVTEGKAALRRAVELDRR